jgi:hypothetical protein
MWVALRTSSNSIMGIGQISMPQSSQQAQSLAITKSSPQYGALCPQVIHHIDEIAEHVWRNGQCAWPNVSSTSQLRADFRPLVVLGILSPERRFAKVFNKCIVLRCVMHGRRNEIGANGGMCLRIEETQLNLSNFFYDRLANFFGEIQAGILAQRRHGEPGGGGF